MTGVSISGVGHCGNFQPGTAIEAFTLSRNHALAIEEICNLALSAWFLESAANLLLGSTCMSADVPDPIDTGALTVACLIASSKVPSHLPGNCTKHL
jgi:hypothetical protein